MFAQPWLAAAALLCAVAATLWGRAASRLARATHRIEREIAGSASGRDAAALARAAYLKNLHTALLYSLLTVGLAVESFSKSAWFQVPLLAVSIPVVVSMRFAPRLFDEARLAEQRAQLERRAEEVLAQEDLAPRRWSDRLAPQDLPVIEGFELGQVYEPGTGMMAGDFYDVYPTDAGRLAVVIGDVAGHGIEPSITAFQVKYLLRNFLRQYRDPGQALEELNQVLSATGRPEDLVSVCVIVFDPSARTLRHASAGHPAAWLWQDSEMRAMRSTGPLLTLDPEATYFSRELPLEPNDVILLYTDGLAEARSGGQLFGEDRIANIIRRDPGRETSVLCKQLLEAARDFASEPLTDDVAILAVRRT
ncbi:MAG TPA: PP2C family protein-serine/threonine phosphatase [Acidimicrobiales bacterium]|jgi:sigma-B regulation protein RsbU (phosphoserine phosphatase)|nr:PP2C family protein-serine/threonine phosphatase [Acidimicrobiales bacterium]